MTVIPDKLVVAVAGAGGPAGRATALHLASLGAIVCAADADQDRLDALLASASTMAPGRVIGEAVDLLDAEETAGWLGRIEAEFGRVDGLVHLVGGWRGSAGFSDEALQHWEFLEPLLVKTAMHTSVAAFEPLVRSGRGRFLLVSAAGASSPTAGNAAYAAAKSAAEAWTLALADAFDRSGQHDGAIDRAAADELPSAAAVLVVKGLVDDEMRAAQPNRTFKGFTPVEELAEAIASTWATPTRELNGAHQWLTTKG